MKYNAYVEGIEVYTDKNFMYCKGNLRGRMPESPAGIVVAIEWFDQDQKALKTEWKRVDVHPDCKSMPSSSDGTKPFIIKSPLDRRAKSVKAYAFSSPH